MSSPRLNYKAQSNDARDHIHVPKLKASPQIINNIKQILLPVSNSIFFVKNYNVSIFDQRDLGSCVANAFATSIRIITQQKLISSRLFHYYNSRAVAGYSIEEDTGLEIRDACKGVVLYGVTQEANWAYVTSRFSELPPLNAYNKTNVMSNFKYSFVNQNLNAIKLCLTTTNAPIIFGINVYDSFLTPAVAKTGIVPMPNTITETLQGGHCVVIVGIDNKNQAFICINSWGVSWGNKGFFTLPYNYVLNSNLSFDFCSISFTQMQYK